MHVFWLGPTLRPHGERVGKKHRVVFIDILLRADPLKLRNMTKLGWLISIGFL